MMIAAQIGPIPTISVSVCSRRNHSLLDPLLRCLQQGVESGDVLNGFGRDHHPMPSHLIGDADRA